MMGPARVLAGRPRRDANEYMEAQASRLQTDRPARDVAVRAIMRYETSLAMDSVDDDGRNRSPGD